MSIWLDNNVWGNAENANIENDKPRHVKCCK